MLSSSWRLGNAWVLLINAAGHGLRVGGAGCEVCGREGGGFSWTSGEFISLCKNWEPGMSGGSLWWEFAVGVK